MCGYVWIYVDICGYSKCCSCQTFMGCPAFISMYSGPAILSQMPHLQLLGWVVAVMAATNWGDSTWPPKDSKKIEK